MLFKEGINLKDRDAVEKSLQEALVDELSGGTAPGLKIKTYLRLFCLILTAITYLPLGKRDYPDNRKIAIIAVPLYALSACLATLVNVLVDKKGRRVYKTKTQTVDLDIDFAGYKVNVTTTNLKTKKSVTERYELKDCFTCDNIVDPSFLDSVRTFVNAAKNNKIE